MRFGRALALSAAIAVLTTENPVSAQVSFGDRATAFPEKPPIAVGVAWYPEQWPEARWKVDLDLMRKTGFNTVRIGEFAWSRMEPREGQFDFAWLDQAIAAARQAGMMVVLGTPTAAPPAWLTSKCPDVLRVDESGARAQHGARRHFSFASQRYRTFARRIAEEMAKRYGNNPAVVGWQIDNEVGPPSFDPESVDSWHAFLKSRYGTIESLNKRWSTEYWSQRYNNFDQVPLHATGQQNPGLLLDFKHYTTAEWTEYVQNQASVIRAHSDPRMFITTNTMFWNAGFDHFAMHRDLDIASWDNYIPDGRPDWVANGANHDLVRGYKQRNFWLMETQPGRVDWAPVNRALGPGQVREMAWQAVGHGANAVLYWQWRNAPNGQETYYGTVLGQDGEPNPLQPEIAKTSRELTAAGPLLADTAPTAKVAFLFSYDSRWSIDLQRHHKEFDPIKVFTDFYRPFRIQSQGVAVLPTDADLSSYPVVVAPLLNVATKEEAALLTRYVEGGGHLLLGPRTGMKDQNNALWPQRQPGPLSDLLGASIAQYYALDVPVGITGALNGTASTWAEDIKPTSRATEIIATYADPGGWLDGKPAVVSRKVGKGRVTYVGAWLEPELLSHLAARLLDEGGVKPIIPLLAPDIEVSERAGAGKRVLIVINHSDEAKPFVPPAEAALEVGEWSGGTLPAHGVALFKVKGLR